MLARARSLLKEIFGYDEFRSLQEEIIGSILERRDALVIMPTGGGKSVCYQIPALIFEGLTVVVSPLISLMKDQVDQLRALGIDAVVLNSTLAPEEYRENMDLIRCGKAKLLYIAPESLMKNEILSLLDSVRLECLAVDEAHCISEWGHDFRPEYRQIAAVRRRFPSAVCVALTATATERVRGDIKKSLHMENPRDFIASFNRENLFFQVVPKKDPLSQTLEFLEKNPDHSGIIYCFSRNQVELLAERLAESGFSVRPYHAGLPDEVRRKNQELFLRDDVRIMVATIAFGMGIHKTNVRFVIHFDLPKSIESYYQETGRAGRDGLPAQCLLLYSFSDVHKIRYFIDQKSDETEKKVAGAHLNALLAYADSDRCRRIPLLAHFGEEYGSGPCGACDNCVSPREPGDDITVPAQMFLSCMVRTGERFGMMHLIDVLRGSESQKILDFRHHTLPTYGVGKEYSKKEWQGLARQFVGRGLIFQDLDNYGCLKLTEKGGAVLRGEEKVLGYLRRESGTEAGVKTHREDYDTALFDLLRAKRKELAEEENVPPYIIFSDKTLAGMASFFPQSRESLLAVHGVGTRKLERYGDAFLRIVMEYCRENGKQDLCGKRPVKAAPLKSPKYLMVGKAFNAGSSIADLMAEHGVKRITILNHLYDYLRDGHHLRSAGFEPLPEGGRERADAVFKAFDRAGAEYLRPAFELLEGTVPFDDLAFYRLYYLSCKTEME